MTAPMPPPPAAASPPDAASSVAAAPKRRRPSWVWLVVGALLLGIVACGFFAHASAGSLHHAERTEHHARHDLAGSRLEERANGRALARYRTRADASVVVAHQILDLDRRLADLATNEGTHARQMIDASLADNVDRYNTLGHEANALKEQTNALLDQLDPLQTQFAARPAT
jgi:hypothetical protein